LGWSQSVDKDGNVTFTHLESGRSSYTDPRLAFATEQTENINDLRQRFDASTTGVLNMLV